MIMKECVALVTGGSRGIGRAVCLALAAEGVAIAVNYAENKAAAAETVEACRSLGVEAEAFQGDVSQPANCAALVKRVKETFGRLDVLVNNAGISKDSLMLTATQDDFDVTLQTNLRSAFFCMKEASRLMLRQRYGRIINISSVVGLRGNPGQAAYAASKAGIIGLTKSAAKELAAKGITVNAVAPGMIDTEMTKQLPDAVQAQMKDTIPMGKPGLAKDIANAVTFFAAPDAAYVTGQVLCVDGGMAI